MMNFARNVKLVLSSFFAVLVVVIYFKGIRPGLLAHRRHASTKVDVSIRELSHAPRLAQQNKDFVPQELKNNLSDSIVSVSKEKIQEDDELPSLTRLKKMKPDVFTVDSLKQAEEEMQKRRSQIHRTCSRLGFHNNTGSDTKLTLPRALVSVNRASVYCPVEKTASTFFRRYVYQLEHTDPMRSPFEVPVKMIYACNSLFTRIQEHAANLRIKRNKLSRKAERIRKKFKGKRKDIQLPEPPESINDFLRRSTNFLFVRDPFSRLFSAYVDKLLAPNPDFWSSWGLFAIQKHRKDPSEKSQRCGHDTTFAEFLNFVLDLDLSPPTADPHVRPIFDLCRPCDVDYSVVGFMNTFQRDVVYLSSLMNVTESQLEFYKMGEDTKKDALEDSVLGAFTEWSHRLAQCVNKGDIVRRIWRKLQIRGFISARINFSPKLLRESVEYLDADDFIKVLAKAVEQSTDKEELKKQKLEAMISAYRTVDNETLKRIVHLYAADFRAFGFNEKPKFIFDRPDDFKPSNNSAALNYRSEWIL